MGAWDIVTREAERQGWSEAASKGNGIQKKQQVMENRQVKGEAWEIPGCIGAQGVSSGKTQPARRVHQLPWEVHLRERNCASLLREHLFLLSLKGARIPVMCFSGGGEDIYNRVPMFTLVKLLIIRT